MAKAKVYTLIKQYEATPREVGRDEIAATQYVVLDMGTEHGRLTLRGLTLEEARSVGAYLYRPVTVKIEIALADDVATRSA